MLIFEVRLHLKEPLVATFDETCAFTSGKSVVVQEMDIPKLTQKYKCLWSHFFSLVTLFLKIIVSNMLIFEIFLHLKKSLVTTLTETREFTSRNYQVKKVLNVPKSLKNTNDFGRTRLFYFGVIASKVLIFEIRLSLKEPLVIPFGETRAHTSRKCVVVQVLNKA